MAWLGRDPAFFLHCELARILPSVRSRYEIRSYILNICCGQATGYRAVGQLLETNWRKNQGAWIMPSTHPLDSAAVQGLDSWPTDRPRPGRWSPHPVNIRYFEKILALGARLGVPVFWVLPPHYQHLDRYFDQPNWNGLYREFARERLSRFSNLIVIDGTRSNYDRDAMVDVSHLNREGAVSYSLALGKIINEYFVAQIKNSLRWVELPAFQKPTTPLVVEDMEQTASRLAGRNDAVGRLIR